MKAVKVLITLIKLGKRNDPPLQVVQHEAPKNTTMYVTFNTFTFSCHAKRLTVIDTN